MKTANMITILTCVPSTEACAHCPAQKDCVSISNSSDFNQQVAQRLSDLLTHLDKTRKQLQEAKLEGGEMKKEHNRLVRDIRELIYEHQIVEE
jgi:peptidoglycan hydrolase CwlO-like protein